MQFTFLATKSRHSFTPFTTLHIHIRLCGTNYSNIEQKSWNKSSTPSTVFRTLTHIFACSITQEFCISLCIFVTYAILYGSVSAFVFWFWCCLYLERPHSYKYFAYATTFRMKSRSVHDFSNFLLSLLAIYNLKLIFQIHVVQTCELRCPPPGHFLHNTRMISLSRHLVHPSAIFFWQNMSNKTSLHICSTFLCISLFSRTHAQLMHINKLFIARISRMYVCMFIYLSTI